MHLLIKQALVGIEEWHIKGKDDGSVYNPYNFLFLRETYRGLYSELFYAIIYLIPLQTFAILLRLHLISFVF